MKLLNRRYKFERTLGQGGMGKVYLMADTHSNNALVAVKECFAKDPSTVERIKREYYFMTQIVHRNLVRAFDFFFVQNRYFIVMEYVEGISLRSLLQTQKTMSFSQQLDIAIQICEAVAALNDNGIIHRDLKPANIVLSQHTPKLLDFGIAKAVNGELATITKTDNIIGTPSYMSPEQIDSRIKMQKNSDVFSLGIVLYQFFAWMDKSPFYAGQMVSTLDRIMHLELPALFAEDKNALQQHRVGRVIQQALQKRPTHRIESVSKMRELLLGNMDSNAEKTNSSLATESQIGQTSRIEKALMSSSEESSPTPYAKYLCIMLLVFLNIFAVYMIFSKRSTQIIANDPVHHRDLAQLNFYNSYLNEAQDDRIFFLRGNLHYRLRQLALKNKALAFADWQSSNSLSAKLAEIRVLTLDMVKYKDWEKKSYILQKCHELQERDKSESHLRRVTILREICSLPSQKNFAFLEQTGYGNLAIAYNTSQIAKKILHLHKSLANISDEHVYLELMDSYIEIECFPEVQSLYRQIKEINPHLIEADILLLKMYLKQINTEKSRLLFEKIMKNDWAKAQKQLDLLRLWLTFNENNFAKAQGMIKKIDKELLDSQKYVLAKVIKQSIKNKPFTGKENHFFKVVSALIDIQDFTQAQHLLNKYQKEALFLTRKIELQLCLYLHLLQKGDKKVLPLVKKYIDTQPKIWDSFLGCLYTLRLLDFYPQRTPTTEERNKINFHLKKAGSYMFLSTSARILLKEDYHKAFAYWEQARLLEPSFDHYITKQQKSIFQHISKNQGQ